MLSLLLLASLSAGDVRLDPVLSIPITEEFLTDATVRGYFAHVLRRGGLGYRDIEAAAFLTRDEDGRYQCIAWPFHGGMHSQKFDGEMPDRTVAIVHTHPEGWPEPSRGDRATALRLGVPIFVLTKFNIYMVDANGTNVPVETRRRWNAVSDSSSTRCSVASSRASRQTAK